MLLSANFYFFIFSKKFLDCQLVFFHMHVLLFILHFVPLLYSLLLTLFCVRLLLAFSINTHNTQNISHKLAVLIAKDNDMISHMDVSHNEIADAGGVALARGLGMKNSSRH